MVRCHANGARARSAHRIVSVRLAAARSAGASTIRRVPAPDPPNHGLAVFGAPNDEAPASSITTSRTENPQCSLPLRFTHTYEQLGGPPQKKKKKKQIRGPPGHPVGQGWLVPNSGRVAVTIFRNQPDCRLPKTRLPPVTHAYTDTRTFAFPLFRMLARKGEEKCGKEKERRKTYHKKEGGRRGVCVERKY